MVFPVGAFGAGGGGHAVGLVDDAEDGSADGGVVEGRVEVVEAQAADTAGGVVHLHEHAAFLEHGELVDGGLLPPVRFAGEQGAGGGGGVGDDVPFDAVEDGDFCSRGKAGAAGRGDVGGVLFVDDAGAGDAFGGEVAVGAAADAFGDHLERVGAGEAFRHDGAHAGGGFAQRVGEQGEALVQAEDDGFVVGGGEFVGGLHEREAKEVAGGPAADAGDAVAGADGFAVVEAQAVAQREAPEAAVVFDDMAGDHLRRGGVGFVGAVEGIEDEEAVVAGDGDGGPDRVERGDVGLGDEAQGFGRLGPDSRGGQGGGRGGQEGASLHWCVPASVCGTAA